LVGRALSGRRRMRKGAYTKGEVNKLIDSLLHPLAEQNPQLLILDGFLHALVEQNPPLSARRFLTYSLPLLICQLGGGDKHTAKAARSLIRQTMRLTREYEVLRKTLKKAAK